MSYNEDYVKLIIASLAARSRRSAAAGARSAPAWGPTPGPVRQPGVEITSCPLGRWGYPKNFLPIFRILQGTSLAFCEKLTTFLSRWPRPSGRGPACVYHSRGATCLDCGLASGVGRLNGFSGYGCGGVCAQVARPGGASPHRQPPALCRYVPRSPAAYRGWWSPAWAEPRSSMTERERGLDNGDRTDERR